MADSHTSEEHAAYCDRQADSCRDSPHAEEHQYEKVWRDRAAEIRAEALQPDYRALYHELLMAVESVYPGETRHQTALRYIREREERAHSAGPLAAEVANG